MKHADFYKPQSELLSRHIEGYYFMNQKDDYPFQYYTFPNNFCILTLMKNASLEIKGHDVLISRSHIPAQISSLTYHYKTQLSVQYLQPVEELTVYFKPNGINHFINNMTDFYRAESMVSFDPYEDFKSVFFKIFDLESRTSQIEYLENQLTSLFCEQKDILIENLLSDLGSDLSIEDIAQKHKISRQYLNQYFKLKIGKSPSEFRKVSRFRKLLESYKNKEKSLTQISYDHLFFDQSHFNRDFKAMTKLNPKEFLAKTDLDQQNKWLIF